MKTLSLFFLLFSVLTFGQKTEVKNNKLAGIIIDKTSNAPLAYVNIGIPDTGIGTVSNGTGRYSLKIPENIKNNDSVSFSFMGYKSEKKSVKDLRGPKVKIYLEPQDNVLGEVVLKTKGLKEKRLGRTNRGLGLMYYNYYSAKEEEVDDRLGKELGMNIKLRTSCIIDKFNFAVSTNEFAKLKLRLNFYSLKNGEPDSLLISNNIIIELREKADGWQTIDLEPYNIYLKEELDKVLMTLQWIESEKATEDSKFFDIPASKSPFHKIYFRDKAMDSWKSQTGSLSMYIDARCKK
jgi:hypothetical protein